MTPVTATHTTCRCWLIRSYDHDLSESLVPYWLKGGFCSVSWGEVPEVPTDASRAEAREIVTAAMPGRPKERIDHVAGALYRFVSVMDIGDVVVTAKRGQPVHVGIVEGPHYYDADGEKRLARRHNVSWLTTAAPLELDSLPEGVREKLMAGQATLTKLDNEAAKYFGAFSARDGGSSSSPTSGRAALSATDPASRYARLCTELAATEHDTHGVRRALTVTAPVRRAKARDAVLTRCDGACENPECEGAPSDVKDSGRPILEVDHIHDIAKGGRDAPEQMIALCPNCHAVKTYGSTREALRDRLLGVAQAAHADWLSRIPGGADR
ncbi:HNH endonuclease [Streptomyces scopuliridis]|uniref:HNH endonuclease n=1 Tax=Streptomyces scopuliridis TaxID=452529 RepID=UPI0036CDCF02